MSTSAAGDRPLVSRCLVTACASQPPDDRPTSANGAPPAVCVTQSAYSVTSASRSTGRGSPGPYPGCDRPQTVCRPGRYDVSGAYEIMLEIGGIGGRHSKDGSVPVPW